ncbi:hypothetical protein [Macrococcoides caseolyticum]|uniref:hypothetical protein n=1 Tax=Macrococcoides caseolyticum TaxID=69966 RepID=UPI001F4227A5|nr:hypothetical protein [Macrococcus caseolyticus]MCE4956735.1 hypothetical protein [Macrococcus caseolyticus]
MVIHIAEAFYVEHKNKYYKVDVLKDETNNYTDIVIIGEGYFKQVKLDKYEDKVEDIALRHLRTYI